MHRIMAALGSAALEAGVEAIQLDVVPSLRNEPAVHFLSQMGVYKTGHGPAAFLRLTRKASSAGKLPLVEPTVGIPLVPAANPVGIRFEAEPLKDIAEAFNTVEKIEHSMRRPVVLASSAPSFIAPERPRPSKS